MVDVTARVHREGRFYVIDIAGFGVTQAETETKILPTVQDYVALMAGVDPGQVYVAELLFHGLPHEELEREAEGPGADL